MRIVGANPRHSAAINKQCFQIKIGLSAGLPDRNESLGHKNTYPGRTNELTPTPIQTTESRKEINIPVYLYIEGFPPSPLTPHDQAVEDGVDLLAGGSLIYDFTNAGGTAHAPGVPGQVFAHFTYGNGLAFK